MNSEKNRLFKSLNNFFDQIYVITLKRSKDRHSLLKKNFDGLKYTLFWAVDGKTLNIDDLEKEGLYHPHLTKLLKKRDGKRTKNLTLPQIGCALSHNEVLKDMVEKGYNKVLILEDDAIPDGSASDTIQQAFFELPDNWDVLYLGHHGANSNPSLFLRFQRSMLLPLAYFFQNFERLKKIDPDVIKCWFPRLYSENLNRSGSHHGAYAYAVSAKGAKKILNYRIPIVLRNDNLLAELCSYEWINAFNLKHIAFHPNKIIKSTIKDAHKSS